MSVRELSDAERTQMRSMRDALYPTGRNIDVSRWDAFEDGYTAALAAREEASVPFAQYVATREWRLWRRSRSEVGADGPVIPAGTKSFAVVPKSRAVAAEQHAEVLAKALCGFLGNPATHPSAREAQESELRATVEPTLQALGYPKEETT